MRKLAALAAVAATAAPPAHADAVVLGGDESPPSGAADLEWRIQVTSGYGVPQRRNAFQNTGPIFLSTIHGRSNRTI
jgi:hypothetical protein